MDRTRASSLESHPHLYNKYDSFSSINSHNIGKRNRLNSLVNNQRECSDDSGSLDYYYKRQRPSITNTDLKSKFDVLQCTVNRMINGGVFDDMGTTVPSVNLSEALKHEYRQMMSALKELENILGCRERNSDANTSSTPCNTADPEIHQLQREIYFRDSLIKCLSDRLKVLCKANDKLIIDYENQENILSEELISLKRQLEKAKEALRSLSMMKSRSNIALMQDIESEAYYLRESLRTKEVLVSDLKHRLDKVSVENADLKCELDNKNSTNCRHVSNSFDRELSHLTCQNEQLQTETETLLAKLECKNQIINELQMKLSCGGLNLPDHSLIEQLRDELLLANEENEMTKEAILEQSDMLEDFRNQIKILSENSVFKDETICELKCCIRQLTECQSANVPMRDMPRNKTTDERGCQSIENLNLINLLNSIKRYVNQHQPDLIRMFDNEASPYSSLEKFMMDLVGMVNKPKDDHGQEIELFKEFLTNEINLKNIIIKHLTTNLTGDIDSLDKLQSQMNYILSTDMDRTFKNDLKNYLHQCFVLDDNLRSVIEYLVKSLNSMMLKHRASSDNTLVDKLAIYLPNKVRETYETNSRVTITTNTHDSESNAISQLEEEIRILNQARQKDRQRFNAEIESSILKLEQLNKKIADLQRLLDGKSKTEGDYKKLTSDYQDMVNKSKQCQFENDRLKGELEVMTVKNKQLERNLNLKTIELENLEKSMRRVSDQFDSLASTQENVKRSIESMKDSEIDRLNKEIANLKQIKTECYEMKLLNSEQANKISSLSKKIESLEGQNSEMKKVVSGLQKELDKINREKADLLNSITRLQEEKDELLLKVNREPKRKSIQTDHNNDLQALIDKLKKENEQLTIQLKQHESELMQLQTSVNGLKMENKSLEVKNQSLISDNSSLENQVRQLRNKITEINSNCDENHINKQAMVAEKEQSGLCQQKILDLETILACLTDELNEKALMVEDLRKTIHIDSGTLPKKDICAELKNRLDLNTQLMLQKESEIAFLKSKLQALEANKNAGKNDFEIQNLQSMISDLERQIDQLNRQLTDKSENITQLHKLLKEKDEIIGNSNRIINGKTDSMVEIERKMDLLLLENSKLKDELSRKHTDESQIKLLKSTIDNLSREIANMQSENEQLRSEIHKLTVERDNMALMLRKLKSQNSKQNDQSTQQMNNEIQKLYIDFEDKSNEIREHSLKEISSRDRKIENLNLELKLKSDQFTTIILENKRLQNRIEDDSLISSRYEQNLLLKEQLLEKLMKEKEKVRATFITELETKSDELNEKNKTVYFLNAELHRMASELELMNSDLQVVKLSDRFEAHSRNTLEISQVNYDSLKTENDSLKLCVNLKIAELETVKNEFTIKQLNSKKNETDLQTMCDSLRHQLKEVQDDYRNVLQTRSTLQSAVTDLEKENFSLKQIKEKLDNEKIGFKGEIDNLRLKIDSLNRNLIECENNISSKTMKFEQEKDEVKRLSNILENNNKNKLNQELSLTQAMQQIDKLKEENSQYKQQIEKLSKDYRELDMAYKLLSSNLDRSNEDVKAKDRELQRYKDLEVQLNNGLKRKSKDCDQLKYEHEELLKQCDQFQRKLNELEMLEQKSHRIMDQKTNQCSYIQENLDRVKNQLCVAEEKLKTCNSQWLDKYGQLKNSFDQIEYDCQNQLETVTQDRDILETTVKNQCNKLNQLNESCHKLNEENGELVRENCIKTNEIDRLCCEKNSLENCNLNMTSQIEIKRDELLAAHTEICKLTVQLHESQSKINEFSFKCKENQSSRRHYGSHPLLNQADPCGSDDYMNFEQKDYCDLKTRYSALCNQIDNLICQLKKKDKRIMDLQKDHDQLSQKLLNYERIQCDYQNLDYKYQQLKEDFNNLSHYYSNINYSHHRQNLQMQDDEVSDAQVCAEELQETINCQNQQLDEFRSSNQILMSDYQMCCERLKQLEKQVQLDNMELEKWHRDFCSSENNYNQLVDKFDQLKYAYDEGMVHTEEIGELKQEITDKSTRIMEITNMNDNIEQQLNCQNQIIEDFKMKIINLESFYEHKLESCRHETALLKNSVPKPYVAAEMNEKINCLKERNQTLENELQELQNQFHGQCLNYNKLKQDNDHERTKSDELRREYDENCRKFDNISAQLFDKTDLIEQLTNENHQICSELEISRQKIDHFTEQVDCLNRRLIEKNNELVVSQTGLEISERNGIMKERESMDLSNQAEYLSEQIDKRSNLLEEYKKELAICYQTIDRMKLEQGQLCEELNKLSRLNAEKDQCLFNKNELLAQYCKELELNYELIQKLQLDKLKLKPDANQEHYLVTPTSPNTDSRMLYNEQDKCQDTEVQRSPCSELTYTTSKSVAWQKTRTDPCDNVGSRVYELQKAIDEYNTLVTSIELSESGINQPKSPAKFQSKVTKTRRGSLDQKIDVDLQNPDEVDVYVVDVESVHNRTRSFDRTMPVDVQNCTGEFPQYTSRSAIQPDFKDIIELLKNCNVQIDYDESKEPFQTYFRRMMEKYNELEQFYLTSMKINLDDSYDPSNFTSMEIFAELYEKSRQKLIQQCQLLKASVAYGTLELNEDEKSVNDQKLSNEEKLKFIELISTQQLQLAALQLTYENLQNLTPIHEVNSQKISPHYLAEEYQTIWFRDDVCDPNIREVALKVHQMSLESKKIPRSKSLDNMGVLTSKKTPVDNLKMQFNALPSSSQASRKSDVAKFGPGRVQNIVTTQESMKSRRPTKNLASASQFTEPTNRNLSTKPATSRMVSSMIQNDTKSMNYGRTSDLNYLPESVKSQRQDHEIRINPSKVYSLESKRDGEPKFQQNFYEGVSMSEGKTQLMKNLEDDIGHAEVGQFEKEMHQLRCIDFDNFDPSINMEDRVRIYAAEIDYLNEKNLFHTYAINVLSNMSESPQKSNFVNQLCDSLTGKAKYINQLQNKFKFDPHMSKKEKELINKVLDPKNNFTYQKLFESWVADKQPTGKTGPPANLTHKINDLTKKLEYCQSQLNSPDKANKDKLLETLISEKKCLTEELNEWKQKFDNLKSKGSKGANEPTNLQAEQSKEAINRLTKENQKLKDQLKTSTDKVQKMNQQYTNEQTKQSKIPLLRGSNIEGPPPNKSMKWDDVNKRLLSDMTNISKNIIQSAESLGPYQHSNNKTDGLIRASKDIMNATGKMTQAIADVNQQGLGAIDHKQEKSLLQSSGKLVSPEDVKTAIGRETSIEHLRQFALLLAEDNFDLAAEIEKLLATIEELRRQLKENCEILSETVDMLQNSENFVNQLEKKLNIETKKTQVISTRIDKLNELNGQLVSELERILKQPPSNLTANMNSQERYDYLFECLKKIEAENINLLKKKEELENELKLIKATSAYTLLGPTLSGPIDFEFETSLMPNGTIEGSINMLNSEDISRTLALTFDMKMTKTDKESGEIAHFLIEQEPRHPDGKHVVSSNSKKKKDNYSRSNNNNNSSFTDSSFSLLPSFIDSASFYHITNDAHYSLSIIFIHDNTVSRRKSKIKLKKQVSFCKPGIQNHSRPQQSHYDVVVKIDGDKWSKRISLSSFINFCSSHPFLRVVTTRKRGFLGNYRRPMYPKSVLGPH